LKAFQAKTINLQRQDEYSIFTCPGFVTLVEVGERIDRVFTDNSNDWVIEYKEKFLWIIPRKLAVKTKLTLFCGGNCYSLEISTTNLIDKIDVKVIVEK
jgi:hypothetical protein